MEDEQLTEDDYRALHEFRYSIRRFERASEQAARRAGVEPQQHQLMLAVRGMPEGVEASIGALAERLQIRHHSAVERVDRVVARGYAERYVSPSDRRSVCVRLTPEGDAVLASLAAYHRSEIRELAPALVRLLGALSRRGDSRRASKALDEAVRETPE